MYRFQVVEEYDPMFQCMSYGILGREYEVGSVQDSVIVPNISCDKDFVLDLAALCEQNQLSLTHLADVVLDAIP